MSIQKNQENFPYEEFQDQLEIEPVTFSMIAEF